MRRLLSIVLALGLVLSFSLVTAVPVLGATFNVPSPGYLTIQSALDDAVSGDTIYVAAGTYFENNLIMMNGVDVLGAGANNTIIDAEDNDRVINASSIISSTAIDGFTITGGSANVGAGIYNNNSSLVVSNCIITGNSAANFGGGMYNLNGSSTTIVNCIIAGNTAGPRGGGIYVGSDCSPTITNCTIAGNTAVDFGGGIYAEGSGTTPTVTNTIIASNSATTGGGIYVNAGTPTLNYNDVWNNTGGNYGGVAVAGLNDFNPPVNPLFENPGFPEYDYHLQETSPCIDVGNNAALPADTADLDDDGNITEPIPYDFEGDPRIWEDTAVPRVDMGADEYFNNAPPDTPTNLGPTEYVDGGSVDDDTPEFSFIQDDPNDYDTVQYTIEIDNNSDFSSPSEADTSALLAQGGADFTSPSLPDDDYYWRVMSTDRYGATSGWAYANGGAVAFRLDTSPAGGGTVGGEVYPIDKAAILLPWLSLTIVLILAAGGLILIRRRS